MEVVKGLYDIEHVAPDDYEGPSKYEREFIIGPIANAGLSKMHAAMHSSLHYHMGRGHQDRHCCAPNFDPGIRMRSRSLRDSLVYGTRKVRTRGLKVDESICMMQFKYRSRSIRDSLVYGTRTKRCRHKHCTAWDHEHDWNIELEKWDIPLSMLKNEKRKTLWFEARQSVLDQEMIRRKSIPRNRYGELETDGGLYCGYYLLEVVLKPWHQGGHPHDFYRHTRDIRPDDWMWEPDWYDPELEKIEYHKRKIKELGNWHRRRNLIGDMRYMFARVTEARRQRRHFQRLKLRLKKKVLLWTELNRNSLWFMPWPEGDQPPELIRRSLMTISKRLSTCAPMWNPYFADLPTCEFYLDHLDELAPTVWDRFHYKCKVHKHLNLFKRRTTLLALIAAANTLSVDEDKVILPPLCEPVLALDSYRKQWVEILATRSPPKVAIVEEQEVEIERSTKLHKKGTKSLDVLVTEENTTTIEGKKGAMDSKVDLIHKVDLDPKARKGPHNKKDEEIEKGGEHKKGEFTQVAVEQHNGQALPNIENKKDSRLANEAHGNNFKVEALSSKRKESVKIDPPPLPAQMTFLKRGKGRQSMVKSPPTLEELKILEILNPSVESEPVIEYVPFKLPIRKQRVRWSIQDGKVPLLPPLGTNSPLSRESSIAALDILDLDKFEEKWEVTKPKASSKKAKGTTTDKKGVPKVDPKKKSAKKK